MTILEANRCKSRHDPDARQGPSIAGVLIGGRSRRMGSPKALIAHPSGGTYIDHVVHVARQVADEVVLLGSPCFALPSGVRHLTVLPDQTPDAGPLAGLEALLAHAGPRWTYMISCDLPCLTPSALKRLSHSIPNGSDAIVYRQPINSEKFHACCACYHGSILPIVSVQLSSDDRSLHRLLDNVNVLALDATTADASALRNVNASCDLCGVR